MLLEIDNLEISKRPSNIKPQTGNGKKRRTKKLDGNQYHIVVTGGSKAVWFKRDKKDWIAINFDDLLSALVPVLEQLDFTPYEEPRGSDGKAKVEK